MTDLSPVLTIAKEILQSSGRKGMHVNEIAEVAVAQNKNMGLSVDNFCKKVSAALAANLKLKTEKPTFAKVNWDKGSRKGKARQGWYRLKIGKITPVVETVQVPQVGKSFFGKAGEYAVMSELLFWGFNASSMTVDEGIDIVASKQGKFFHIQVKTASRQENGKYQFTLSQASFKKYHAANVFYVFVLRDGIRNEYFILSSTHIDYCLNAGIIANSPSLTIVISSDQKNSRFSLNAKFDITQFYGKFGEIIA